MVPASISDWQRATTNADRIEMAQEGDLPQTIMAASHASPQRSAAAAVVTTLVRHDM